MSSTVAGITSLAARDRPYKFEIVPLSEGNRVGLMTIGCIALLSSAFSFMAVAFMTRRMIVLRYTHKKPLRNQGIILIYNILIASFIQSISLVFEFEWLRQGHVPGPVPSCFAQGWLLHFGNLAAGIFVTVMAVLTACDFYRNKYIREFRFLLLVLGSWIAAFLIASIAPMIKGKGFFVRVGAAWCCISPEYPVQQMVHYSFLFIFTFGSSLGYGAVVIRLIHNYRYLLANERVDKNSRAMKKHRGYIFFYAVYPLSYVLTTLPLTVELLLIISGKSVSDVLTRFAGCALASIGLFHVLLYWGCSREHLMEQLYDKPTRLTKVDYMPAHSPTAESVEMAAVSDQSTNPSGATVVNTTEGNGSKKSDTPSPTRDAHTPTAGTPTHNVHAFTTSTPTRHPLRAYVTDDTPTPLNTRARTAGSETCAGPSTSATHTTNNGQHNSPINTHNWHSQKLPYLYTTLSADTYTPPQVRPPPARFEIESPSRVRLALTRYEPLTTSQVRSAAARSDAQTMAGERLAATRYVPPTTTQVRPAAARSDAQTTAGERLAPTRYDPHATSTAQVRPAATRTDTQTAAPVRPAHARQPAWDNVYGQGTVWSARNSLSKETEVKGQPRADSMVLQGIERKDFA